jgi:hypothetical protein
VGEFVWFHNIINTIINTYKSLIRWQIIKKHLILEVVFR